MCPDEAKDWGDLDNWFDRHKAQISICLATAALPFTRTRRQSAMALTVLVACLAWVVGISTLRLLGWTPWATGMVPLAE
jgi:hypothetical protein